MSDKEIEETKAELREWVVRNCLLDRIKVEEIVERMYNNLQEIGEKLLGGKTGSTGPK